ncbi:MAG TPA: hypothetical protein PK360_13435, partial [bacterium]|nr:hypothetical protein [bacterium]
KKQAARGAPAGNQSDMNSTPPFQPKEEQPTANRASRPSWYGLALWLNPVITWVLLLAIFTFTPLTQKVLLLDTDLDPRFGQWEEILRGQDIPCEIKDRTSSWRPASGIRLCPCCGNGAGPGGKRFSRTGRPSNPFPWAGK